MADKNTIQSWEDPKYFLDVKDTIGRAQVDIALPSQHHCLLAEITSGGSLTGRAILVCNDGKGEAHFMLFRDEKPRLDMLRLFEHFKVGNTVAVLFPASRQLVDGSIAVDIHYTDTVLIMPLKLEEALAMNRLAIEFVNRDGTPRKCHACGKVKENLSQCGRCVLFGYCDRECQVKAWDDHKKFCKVLKDVNVRSLMLMDFNQTWDSILAFE